MHRLRVCYSVAGPDREWQTRSSSDCHCSPYRIICDMDILWYWELNPALMPSRQALYHTTQLYIALPCGMIFVAMAEVRYISLLSLDLRLGHWKFEGLESKVLKSTCWTRLLCCIFIIMGRCGWRVEPTGSVRPSPH